MRRKAGFFFIAVLGAAALMGCPSTPKTPEATETTQAQPIPEEKPKPPAEPAPEEQPQIAEQPAPEGPAPEPLRAQDIEEARAAFGRAREWGAEHYDPSTYKEARALFDKALDEQMADPDKARELLAKCRERAEASYAHSIARFAEDIQGRLDAMVAKLLDLEADKFMAAEYAEATSDLDQIRSLFQSGNPVRGHRLGYEKLKAVSELLDAVDSGIRAAKYARWEAERSMGEAEKVEAAQWAPEEKKKSNEFYLAGSRALREYDLEGAQENYGKARDTAKACIALAAEREARANERVKRQAEEMMMDLMKVIESASELTIVTADGTVVSPKKWSGEHTLKELEEEQPPVDSAGSDNQSLRIPSGEGTVVLGETSEETLLAQARELWKLGAIEKNKGNADGAIEHFREASRYVEAYKRLAVAHVYTVRLNTAQRECLWRIAEQRSIFDNPRLWPILWRRNRNLIAAPDLILPGKKLVIPALPSDKVELRRSCSRARRLYTTPHRRDPPISPEAVKSPPTT